mmetsp:Transcript_7619/g.15183  ORF Transcript_7619/g.15183 Transcript_7619/m.15183 type:complete len:151 (+) Transcript_7619:1-453(+)
MDHSIASVRRYPDIKLYRDDFSHSHAGMIVHPGKRILFISNPGKNGGEVTAVRIDTGRYSRTAREEYPIFSNRLPSFEYSIYECTEEVTMFFMICFFCLRIAELFVVSSRTLSVHVRKWYPQSIWDGVESRRRTAIRRRTSWEDFSTRSR